MVFFYTYTPSTHRYDVEGGTTFSPPAHDDSFFYIRYPVGGGGFTTAADATTNMKSLSDALGDVQLNTQSSGGSGGSGAITAAAKNLTKHTEPCKMFLNNKERKCTYAYIHPYIYVHTYNEKRGD